MLIKDESHIVVIPALPCLFSSTFIYLLNAPENSAPQLLLLIYEQAV